MPRRPEIGNVQLYPDRPLRKSDRNGYVLNFIVRFSANGSAETAVLATVAKPARFNVNVRNDCSTVTTNHQMGRSLQHMLCRNRFCRKQSWHQRNLWAQHGRNAMTGTSTIAAFECETNRWSRLSRDLALRSVFSKLSCGSQIVRRDF